MMSYITRCTALPLSHGQLIFTPLFSGILSSTIYTKLDAITLLLDQKI